MEGCCRASSPLSIADSSPRFNAKWPKNWGFLHILRSRADAHVAA